LARRRAPEAARRALWRWRTRAGSRIAALALAAALVPAAAAGAHAERRVALVIGNSDYRHAASLRNPVNDATDMADVLERMGFRVVRGLNLDYAGMRENVRRFTEILPGADVSLFYYAGHGLQLRGRNYLAPVDAKLTSEADLDFTTIDLDLILRNMEREVRTNIVFLDACRDNPLANNLAGRMGSRSGALGRGLARVESGVGTLIAFATQPGNVALDGDGRNSPFTEALLHTIERPGVPLGDVMIAVRNEVLKRTNRQQVPWEHSSLTGQFYVVPPPPPPAAQRPATAAASGPGMLPEPAQASLEIAFWDSIKGAKNPRLFEAYLRRYPNGVFSDLAKISIEEARLAALKPAADEAGLPISDPGLLREIRERLYELNFDPGPNEGPFGEQAHAAIREFQASSKLAATGLATRGLLDRLREVGGLKPWGAIVYAKGAEKWGMSWNHASRKEAVASARASCGDAKKCASEVSFFGTECGAFAHSGSAWAMSTRDDVEAARKTALAECGKRDKNCRIIATVCADGADRFRAGN
jgi:hypothetical protein